MSPLYRLEDIHNALAALETKSKVAVSRDDEDDMDTIRPCHSSSSKTFDTTFEGFKDFELDLSCLSAPSSPVASTSYLPPSSPSPPPSPPLPAERSLSRTRSFAAQAISPLIKSTKKLSTPQLSSMTLPSGSRGSWPGIKYTGRGTPIDRKRNRQWGGFISEEEEGIGEDGFLFSNVRSASLDSHIRPPKRSMSPEWSYLPAFTTSASISSQVDEDEESVVAEPPPALAPINLGVDKPDEWDSIMQTVLGSTNSNETPLPTASPPSGSSEIDEAASNHRLETAVEGSSCAPPVDFPMMTPDQIEELHNGLETHLGIHQALDLGLGIGITQGLGIGGGGGKMNLFKLGLLPSSASGRETPSIYSQAETPRASPPATIVHHDQRADLDHETNLLSTTSTKAVMGVKNENGIHKPIEHPWWRKVLRGMRRIQDSINYHKNRMP